MSDKAPKGDDPKQARARNVEEEARTKIKDRAAAATPEDHAAVAAIIERAEGGKYGAGLYTLTAPQAALIFINHNDYNRGWTASGNKGSTEYARRMLEHEWEQNGDTIRFYTDGNLADGQGRTGGQALAGLTMEVIIAFGINRTAVGTIDDGRARQGKDTAALQGVENAGKKQTVLKQATNYMAYVGQKEEKIHSNVAMARELQANNEMLETAIDIGFESINGVSGAILKPSTTAVLAYLMLRYGGWTVERAKYRLRQIQEGLVQEPDGEKVPYFIANETIKKARSARESRDRLMSSEEIALVLHAVKSVENNVSAITQANLRAAIKKERPNPLHPSIEKLPRAAE